MLFTIPTFASIKYSDTFFDKIICQQPTELCYDNNCNECKNGTIFKNLIAHVDNLQTEITWYSWIRPIKTANPTVDKTETSLPVDYSQLKKVVKEGTEEDLVSFICDLLPKFIKHVRIKRHQSAIFKSQVHQVQSDGSENLVLQFDFAEKFVCEEQDQPQAAHFGTNKISIFTVALWHRSIYKSYAMVCDILQQDKFLVAPLIDRLFQELPETAKKINIWTDNAGSQFKNKYMMSIVQFFISKFSMQIEWNFFAEQHGKGVVDGIGAAVKQIAHTKIRSRRTNITNAKDFAAACEGSAVNVILMTVEDVKNRQSALNVKKLVEKAKNIKNISIAHNIKFVENKIIGCSITKHEFF
jgi:hypothetical protein